MFSAGCPWKLYVVSAVVALASLPAVELANAERHTLSRRAVEVNNIRCGDSWAAQAADVLLESDRTACRGYDGKFYSCETSTCKYGPSALKNDPNGPYSLGKWRFTGCTGYPLSDDETMLDNVQVSPAQFWAQNVQGQMVVKGWDDESNDKRTRLYKCTWKNRADTNNQRPVCGRCVQLNFQDAPVPTLPS